MRKYLIGIFLLFSISVFAQSILKDSISIYSNKNELLGTMPISEFKILIDSAKLYHDELLAENNKRIKIVVKENQPIVKLGETFTADVHISWMNEKQETIKEMILENSITIKKENLHQYRVVYRDISEVGFPATLIIIFVLILAL